MKFPFQSGTSKIGATPNPIGGAGGIWRIKIRNSGPVAVRIGDDQVDFDNGFLLAPGDPWIEILTDAIVYTVAPPNAAGIGQARIDYIAETR